MDWSPLTELSQIDDIVRMSHDQPCGIFKHSTTCSISAMAKLRLESAWDIPNFTNYFLDLLAHRPVSNAVAEKFSVHHESPQYLIIYKGECIYDGSHFDISLAEVKECLEYHNLQPGVTA